MKINMLALLLALALAGAADAAQRGGGHGNQGGPNSGGGHGGGSAPGPSAAGPSASGPSASSGPNSGTEADTRGEATRAYVSDYCYWHRDPSYCKAR